MIEKHPNHYIFGNPGRLRLSVDAILAGGESDPRNPILHSAFLLAGFAERAGSGMTKILDAWSEQHWRRPVLEEKLDMIERTTLTLDMASLLPADAVAEVEEMLGEVAFASLSPEERVILILAYIEEVIDHARLKEAVDLHSQDLTRALQRLMRMGYLLIVGREGSVKYALGTLDLGASQSVPKLSQSSPHSSQSVPKLSQSSPYSSQSSLWDEDEQLRELAASHVRGRGWAEQEGVVRAIYEMCGVRALSVSELSGFLGRAEKTIKYNYLKLMIEQGDIVRVKPTAEQPEERYALVPKAGGGEE